MGGEKLKLSRPYKSIFFTALFILAGLFCTSIPLSAQTGEPSPDAEIVAPEASQSAAATESSLTESSLFEGSTTFFEESSPSAPVFGNGSSIFVVVRMVLVLALSALAIYGVFFFIKRLARPQESRDPHLKILARVPLSNDSYAAVLSIGSKAWLVGGGSASVNLISEISDIESLDTMLLDDARRAEEAGARRFDFSSLIRRFGASQEGKGQSGISQTSSLKEILQKQRERLKRL